MSGAHAINPFQGAGGDQRRRPPRRGALRAVKPSKSDLGINFGLILCIMGAAFLVDVEQQHGERVLGEYLFATIMLALAVVLLVVAHTTYRRLKPHMNGIFCHHKGGAAVLGGRCGLCCHHKGGAAAPPL